MTFSATIRLDGKTATGIRVPEEVVHALGAGKRPPVRVTIGGHTYRSTVAPMGGEFLLPLSAENRSAAGIRAGDQVTVSIELDEAPRTVELPADLRSALEARSGARAAYEALAFSKKKELVRHVAEAKAPETRLRRIAAGVEKLMAPAEGNPQSR